MKKNKNFIKKLTFSFVILLFISIVTYCILSQFNFFQNYATMINNKVYSRLLPKDTFKTNFTPNINFEDMPIYKINDVTLSINGEHNIENTPILLKSQRYYLPIDFIANKLNYTFINSNNQLELNNNINKILLATNSYEKNSQAGLLRGNILNYKDCNYISLSDIENLFNLIAIFDFKTKNITLLPNTVVEDSSSSIKYSKKIAMLRFEDFTAGDSMATDINQTKVKCMANLLYSNKIKFHIAWIPRFKAPLDNIDNDLLSINSIENVGFINLLDYLINKGGEIGLHGYTHQSGTERSAAGEELSKDVNNSIEATRDVIENGINTANALNIPCTFYESPHYRDTKLQQDVIEEYFQFIYEPFDNSQKNIYKTDTNNLYVPTPLGFVENSDLSSIINGLNKSDPKILHSFFYHPSIEIDYINYDINNDNFNIKYDQNSPLNQIVKSIKDNDYTTIHIDQLIDK